MSGVSGVVHTRSSISHLSQVGGCVQGCGQ